MNFIFSVTVIIAHNKLNVLKRAWEMNTHPSENENKTRALISRAAIRTQQNNFWFGILWSFYPGAGVKDENNHNHNDDNNDECNSSRSATLLAETHGLKPIKEQCY